MVDLPGGRRSSFSGFMLLIPSQVSGPLVAAYIGPLQLGHGSTDLDSQNFFQLSPSGEPGEDSQVEHDQGDHGTQDTEEADKDEFAPVGPLLAWIE